jgi:hypothetical protein
MPEDNRVEDDDVETGEGSAGTPESLDPQTARSRWESRQPQPEERFEERQRRIGSTRRRGGPQHPDEGPAREDAQEDAADVPATEPDGEDGE